MSSRFPLFEILQSIAAANRIYEDGWQERLAVALRADLNVAVSAVEVRSASSLSELTNLLQSRLPKNLRGRTIVDVYLTVEKIVNEELSHKVNYHWHGTWLGDVLNETDSLDDVEIVIRMEETFKFSIPDRDAQQWKTVGRTVRYLWSRIQAI